MEQDCTTIADIIWVLDHFHSGDFHMVFAHHRFVCQLKISSRDVRLKWPLRIRGKNEFWSLKVQKKYTTHCIILCTHSNFTASNSVAARFVGVSSTPMNWTAAQTYCRKFHTDLASSLNQGDNDLLAQVASVQGPSWFGLYRDTWKWLNGTVATNILWGPGQPDNNYTQENCGAIYNNVIIDENCSSLNYFFCDYSEWFLLPSMPCPIFHILLTSYDARSIN